MVIEKAAHEEKVKFQWWVVIVLKNGRFREGAKRAQLE